MYNTSDASVVRFSEQFSGFEVIDWIKKNIATTESG